MMEKKIPKGDKISDTNWTSVYMYEHEVTCTDDTPNQVSTIYKFKAFTKPFVSIQNDVIQTDTLRKQ